MSVHELFRLLVGEIGISRHEFWYELTWREVRAIIDGYNRRRRDGWEQARLVAYHVAFCMGVPKGKTAPLLTEWLPFYWEKPTGTQKPTSTIPKNVVDELQAFMDDYNREHAADTTK